MKNKYYLWLIGGIALTLILAGFVWGESLQVFQANKTFAKGEFNKARAVYEDLLVKKTKSPYLLHNQGLCLYRENQLQPAIVCFKKALANKNLLQELLQKLHYHLGSVSFKTAEQTKEQNSSQLYQTALQSFKKAILAGRDDLDSKYNYELTKLRVKEAEDKKEEQKQNNNQPSKEDQKQQNQEKKNQDQKDQDQKDQNKKDSSSTSPSPTPGKEEQSKASQSQATAAPKTGMSKKEAEALLKMVENGEQYQGPKSNAEPGLGTKDW